MKSAILLAAGSGRRMGSSVPDKILAPLAGIPVFMHSVNAFLRSGSVDGITIVFRDDEQKSAIEEALGAAGIEGVEVRLVEGGAERQDSVERGLKAQPEACEHVFIHDCARPLVSVASIQAVEEAVVRDGAAVLAHRPVDTLKRVPDPAVLCGAELEDLERDRLWAMETPQAFRYAEIVEAYAKVNAGGIRVTDDVAAAASAGTKATIVVNESPNPKITTEGDLDFACWLLDAR